SGELRDHPFGVVGRPHADAVAALEPECQQARSEGVHPFLQLSVSAADLLVPDDERIAVCKALGDPIEMPPDRIANEWRVAGAVNLTQPRHSSVRLPLLISSAPRKQGSRATSDAPGSWVPAFAGNEE